MPMGSTAAGTVCVDGRIIRKTEGSCKREEEGKVVCKEGGMGFWICVEGGLVDMGLVALGTKCLGGKIIGW